MYEKTQTYEGMNTAAGVRETQRSPILMRLDELEKQLVTIRDMVPELQSKIDAVLIPAVTSMAPQNGTNQSDPRPATSLIETRLNHLTGLTLHIRSMINDMIARVEL